MNKRLKIIRICILALCALFLACIIISTIYDIDGLRIIEKPRMSIEEAYDIVSSIAFIGIVCAVIIYYIDMSIYAKQLFKHNQQGIALIGEYQKIIKAKSTDLLKLQEENDNIKLQSNIETSNIQKEFSSKEQLLNDRVRDLNERINNISSQKAELEERIRSIQVLPNYSNICLSKLKHSDICFKLQKQARKNEKGKREQFVELESIINSLYPNFTKRLYDFIPDMSEKQLNVCLLLKADFSNNDIAVLLCMHYSSISHLKSRMMATLKEQNIEIENLSEFLNKL